MQINLFNYEIVGSDNSQHDGDIDWQKVDEYGMDFSIIRVGYGRTLDLRFLKNWLHSRGRVHRSSYWYLDYYSKPFDITDKEWGIQQAIRCWSYIKNDNDKGLVWLDIENGIKEIAPPILSVWARVQTMATGFLEKIDELSGKENGVYCNLSTLPNFSKAFRDRPLWLAFYNESETIASVQQRVTNAGWTGPLLFWQFARDGDADGDNRGDGKEIGFSRDIGDLDIWTSTKEKWELYKQGLSLKEKENGGEMKLYYPLPEGYPITQVFGVNPQWYTTSRGHNGIDWGCPVGTPIYAMQDGKVTTAVSETYGYGRHVRISHDGGAGVSIYGHLSKLKVKQGGIVKAKQLIGLSGGAVSDPYSGYSTGPHLHAEYRLTGVKNPVPGGYYYNAINILPLIVSHDEIIGTEPLYRIQIAIPGLNVRSGPGVKYGAIRLARKPEIYNVYQEKDSWGRISNMKNEWVILHNDYIIKVGQTPPPEQPPEGPPPVKVETWMVTTWYGLNIRSGPGIAYKKLGLFLYRKKFEVESIDKRNWGKLSGRDGYVSLNYATKV